MTDKLTEKTVPLDTPIKRGKTEMIRRMEMTFNNLLCCFIVKFLL